MPFGFMHDVTYMPFPDYLLGVLGGISDPANEEFITYAHLGDCGEWDKHGGDGSIPDQWRCGPSANPDCADSNATGEPDCLVGHLVKPPANSWTDFDPDEETKDGAADVVPATFCAGDMAGGNGPLSPFWAYYAPGQPESEKWDKIIEESMDCEPKCTTFDGRIECGGVPGSIPSPEPGPPFYDTFDHDYLPGYIRILPVGPLISYEDCTPAATPACSGELEWR